MRRRSSNSESGAILLIVIILMLAFTITGMAFLNMAVMEHNLAMREVHKTQAFYLADAGIERLRFKLYAGEDEPQIPDWISLGDGDYKVEGFYSATPPYAISTGRITNGDRQVLKKIKVRIYKSGLFDYGIFADEGIRMTGVGGNYKVSSYDSNDPTSLLPDGLDQDQATIGTNGNGPEVLDLQNSQVNGSAYAGPGANVEEAIKLGPQGEITGEEGVLSVRRPMEVFVPEGADSLVADKGPLELADGEESTISIDGYYSSINVHGMLIIDADCLLKVDTLTIGGEGSIVVTSTAYVTLYLTQWMRAMGGGLVNESEVPAQLRIYGGTDCNEIEIGGTPDFYGVVYAPNADVFCNGTGDVYGSVVGGYVRVGGTPHVYWDMALLGDPSIPVVTTLGNWEEIA